MTDRPRPSALWRALLPLLAALAFVPAVLSAWRPEEPRRFEALPPASSGPEEPARYVERFIEARPSQRSLHTPTVTELPGGDLLAVWKAARSGDAAVVLHAARFDRRAGAWGTPWPVTTSHRTERELGRVVSTLTNPVLFTRGDGEVSLVYVTAWWKWSSSSVALKTSRDEGRTWTPARRLVTSPVANAGTLVRAAPVRYRDGSVGVPAYHELVGVFPQMLRLSASGEVLDRTRMHRGEVALQPSVVPLDDRHAVALMRNYLKGQVYVTRTEDAGASWGAVTEAGLPNPNSPVMAVRLRDGAILLVFNNSRNSRERLSLALSRDGGERWSVFHGLEDGVLDHEGNLANFGYPYAIQGDDGTVHVLYVWHQLTHVKHVSFNEAWIRERAVTADTLRQIVGLGGIELALAAVAVAICGAAAGRRGAPWGLLVAAVALAPLGGIPLAGYVRGVTGDLSVPTLALLAAALAVRLSPWPLLAAADRGALHAWAAAAGVLLYPLTLGLTLWDPYALGYRPRALLLVAAALVIAWWRRRRGAALVLAAGVAAFGAGLMESTNLWDYLVDPAVATWALAAIAARSPAGRRVALLLDRALSGMRAARARRTGAPSPAGPRR